MKFDLLLEIPLGDMMARYVLERKSGQLELQLLPAAISAPVEPARQRREPQGLVQAYFTGEKTPRGYGNGGTYNQSGTVKALRVVEQQRRPAGGGVEVATVLEHPNGCRFTHYLSWDGNAPVVTAWTEVENRGTEPATLEQLASFSLGGSRRC